MNGDPKEYLATQPKLVKLGEQSAAAVCQLYELPDEVTQLLNEKFTPAQFLAVLLDQKFYKDGAVFLAHALPKREAIWWSYLCVASLEEAHNGQIKELLRMVKDWVYNPSDKNRRAAGALAEKVGFKSAASWVGMAVFWSGGSITALDQPEVLPAPALMPQAISGAVMLAAVAIPEKSEPSYQRFICQALDIASGGSGLIV